MTEMPPCWFCGGKPDRLSLVELPITRVTPAGSNVVKAARRIPICKDCAKDRKRRFPAARKAKQDRWAEWWGKQQDSLF